MANAPQSPAFDLDAFNTTYDHNVDSPINLRSLTGPGGQDLSLSELSINDVPGRSATKPEPFSLFASESKQKLAIHGKEDAADASTRIRIEDEVEHAEVGEEDGNDHGASTSRAQRQSTTAPSREEKLQSDLYILRKLNSSFTQYIEAMTDAKEMSERVASRMAETNQLLDSYVDILWETEQTSQLVFDETWEGGIHDDEVLEERQQRALEEAERSRREDLERRDREAAERARRESERLSSAIPAGSGGVRGVRGVRGLRAGGRTRGGSSTRGDATASSTGIGRGSIPTAKPSARGIPAAKRVSPALRRGTPT